MTAARLLGLVLVTLPFLAIAVWEYIAGGWLAVIATFGGAALVIACLSIGMRLLDEESR